MAGLLFITAPTDLKRLNRALAILRDWEYCDGDYSYKVVTTRNAYELESPDDEVVQPTEIPLPEDFDNAWSNASIPDVEAYMLDLHRSLNAECWRANTTLFLVLDEEGLAKDEVVLCKREYVEEGEYEERFKKTRLPLEEAQPMFANLDISHMDFADFVHDGEGEGEDGWWVYRFTDGLGLGKEAERLREEELERLRGVGEVE